jgi:hypothetical protein
MRGRIWTEKDLKYLEARYPHEKTEVIAAGLRRSIRSVYSMANFLGIKKTNEFMWDYAKSGRCSMIEGGKKYRFQKGHQPANKGKKTGSRGRMIESQFKPGHLPQNTLYDGAISIRNSNKRPYKWIRVSLGRWELLHREVWRERYGQQIIDKIEYL